MSRVTIKDIAREAGVSIATVSYVINGTKKTSAEKHQKITEAIKKLDYTPNISAKNLRLQKTKIAGLVVSSYPSSYINGVVDAIGSRSRELGYNLLFVNTNENDDHEKDAINLLTSNAVDGIILSPATSQLDYLKKFINQQLPIVLVNRYDPRLENIPWVTADDFQAGYDATMHLIQHGHKNIGVISVKANVTTYSNRIEGYKQALISNKLPYDERFIERDNPTATGGYHAALSLLNREKNITAVFVQTDLMTIGAVKALKSLSLRCPDDVALIGFGDFDAATITDPPITNISIPPDSIGRTAFDLLLNRINNPEYNKHIHLPTSLIIRKSCGC